LKSIDSKDRWDGALRVNEINEKGERNNGAQCAPQRGLLSLGGIASNRSCEREFVPPVPRRNVLLAPDRGARLGIAKRVHDTAQVVVCPIRYSTLGNVKYSVITRAPSVR